MLSVLPERENNCTFKVEKLYKSVILRQTTLQERRFTMKKMLKSVLFTILFFAAALSAAEGKKIWSEDYLQARKTAAEKKLPMLILFSGSDWCPPCIRLDKTVLDTKEFADYAPERFVLFKADFPRRSQQAEKVVMQNRQLMHTYKVQGVPTVILTGSDGKEFARTGFLPGGVQNYIKHLEELRAKAPKK